VLRQFEPSEVPPEPQSTVIRPRPK
jgi:hypothetical protein